MTIIPKNASNSTKQTLAKEAILLYTTKTVQDMLGWRNWQKNDVRQV